ncbi:chromosome segregation protein SMC [Microbacterium sp. LRZ72]|uniref:chromosome segregation protein SMC n=1 Tax=Microbacterium sp. LRZ72 TaxID=2942481 RepID=UPI0029A0C445|nr:chromosome segregation protein SMC [Microbacterium sp. LRZ72]MDX2375592.1 chromosome segregation protein SMC [Microbacterium sp. LRZ72]
MHLKSVTLRGFKSFAQATTFALEPGVTAIVGPNGSGKSNVVDALAWVMGEQGAKTLRGGKMEDVIFAGTSSRGPLGRAEVQLTIDNADGALPIEFSEVAISRTLFRNGASEYAINGETCRLLDVQELLSDSGLGREMHVIVGQGRLDTVLQATPEERRGFIEEAAGILKHRRRKEKTLRKLEAMETNLMRLSDLAGEIRRQLKPLGRQAEIAREAEGIAATVRDAKARLFADEVVTLRTALADHARSEQERHTERMALQDRLSQLRERIVHLEADRGGDDVDAARAVVHSLERVQERARSLYTLANQRLALLGADEDDAPAAAAVAETDIDEARARAQQLSDGLGEAQDAAARAARAVAHARGELDALDSDIAAQSALVSEHDMRLTALRGAADASASAVAAMRGALDRQESALQAARARRAEADEARAGLESGAEADDPTDHAAEYEAAGREASQAEAELQRLRDEQHRAEREVEALTAQTAALTRALTVRNAAAALLEDDLAGVQGLVGDQIQVRAGFEAAIAAVLGPLAEGLLVARRDDAYAVLAAAAEGSMGSVDVLVADAGRPAPALAPIDGVRRAVDVVTAPDGVQGYLSHVVVADDIDVARRAWPQVEQAFGPTVTLVTLAGEVTTAHLLRGGDGGSPSRLALLAERDAAARRLDEVQTTAEQSRSAAGEAGARLTAARRRAEESLAALREHDAAQAARAETANRITVRHEAAVAECERLETGVAQAKAALDEAEVADRRAHAELEHAQQAPRPILDASAREAALAEVETAREAEMRARLDVEALRERIRSQEARVAGLVRQRETERQAAEEAARRAVIRRGQREAASGVIEQLPPLLDSIDRSLSHARVALGEAEASRTAHNAELKELRAQEGGLRERLAALTEGVHALELQIHEQKLHVNAVLERARSELGLGEEVLVAEYGPDQPVPNPTAVDGDASHPDAEGRSESGEEDAAEPVAFDREGQRRILQQAERKLAQLGRVNPLALEEFAALEQRHAFLTEQLADLTETRADLLTIIGDLDQRMRGIFEAAFEDTRAAFADVFPLLFPGGTGSISLTQPDDLLTTGIEVSVKPAGKKIERLSLLSGGERSLAAVALLTAIFKARPSPFYILDEVEAALDDANLGRLLRVFEQLRESSQLIVITHQKRTMEIADALYGVSMRQDGVSAVVGQRIVDRAAS